MVSFPDRVHRVMLTHQIRSLTTPVRGKLIEKTSGIKYARRFQQNSNSSIAKRASGLGWLFNRQQTLIPSTKRAWSPDQALLISYPTNRKISCLIRSTFRNCSTAISVLTPPADSIRRSPNPNIRPIGPGSPSHPAPWPVAPTAHSCSAPHCAAPPADPSTPTHSTATKRSTAPPKTPA